ncbi:penicillin-binding protein 1C [candidate division KSB1 bacterium]|nr:penicillin-binding protein 1C [candidate division KSB1 bacterium]
MTKPNKTIIIGVGALLLLILFLIGKPSRSIVAAPDYSQMVYDRNGMVLRITLAADEKYRIHTTINAVSPLLKQAILMKEDRFFYYHPGVNPLALVRAGIQTIFNRDKKIGGSTITMQVTRLYYQLNTRTLWGKLNQIVHALYLELYFSKNEILSAYINIAPCGGNIEGFAAASWIYFGKDVLDLTLQEALFLSVLPQNPSAYHPKDQTCDDVLLNARQRLFTLWKKKHPNDKTTTVHIDMPLNLQYHLPFHAPHYVNALLDEYPREHKIYSTLDLSLQNTVTRLTQRYIQRKQIIGVNNAAVMLLDARTMQILASLGSADFFNDAIDGQVDGTRSRRSPGSTLKPFIYALAMEQGLIHPMTMLKDAPISFSEYAPDNYERDFKGPIKAWEALVTSRNVPAVTLASQIKEPDLYDFLANVGVGNLQVKVHYGLSIVLGSAELSMNELIALYGILANNGMYQPLIDAFTTDKDQYEPPKQYLTPESCFLVKEILRQNPRPGASRVPFQQDTYRPVAYKTGTSIGFKDCWSIGLFEHYIVAVWLGNFNGYGNPVFNGRQLATPLMFEIIDSIEPDSNSYMNYENPPSTVTKATVCAVSGQLAQPWCARRIQTYYIPGTSPITSCQICREIYVNTKTGYRTFKHSGPHIQTQVVEFWSTNLLALFRKAGIPRKIPPPFDPNENLDLTSITGTAPTIVSPVTNTEYLMQPDEAAFNNLPLIAHADADVQEMYWFVDQKFIGKTTPDETQYWSLAPGRFQISVVDDHGRSDYRDVHIGTAAR